MNALGGRCLLDLGSYAAAVVRLFGKTPRRESSVCLAHRDSSQGIDAVFTLLTQFEDGARCAGHCSFESEYRNRLELVCSSKPLTVDRMFSPPADYAGVWNVHRNNKTSEDRQEPADVFVSVLQTALTTIGLGKYAEFANDMSVDAEFCETLAVSLGYRGNTQ